MRPAPRATAAVPARYASVAADGRTGLDALRRTVARLERGTGRPAPAGVPMGLGALQDHLPGCALAGGALHEVAPAAPGDAAAAFGFLVALLVRVQDARPGPLVLAASRHAFPGGGVPYGHGLARMGLDVARLVVVRSEEARRDDDILWSLEETLRAAVLGTAVAGVVRGRLGTTAGRRLSLAASDAGIPLLLLRLRATAPAATAATRWRIAAAPAARDRFGCLASCRWNATLERCRHGRAGRWIIEWDHVAHRFRMAEVVADRTPDAGAGGLRRAG